jgi:antitoxin ParD1/3/4
VASIDKRTITLPADQARYLDSLVASGRYASESDVISAGLRALQEREAGIERWLREEVAPVYDAMQADPRPGHPGPPGDCVAGCPSRGRAEGGRAWHVASSTRRKRLRICSSFIATLPRIPGRSGHAATSRGSRPIA